MSLLGFGKYQASANQDIRFLTIPCRFKVFEKESSFASTKKYESIISFSKHAINTSIEFWKFKK